MSPCSKLFFALAFAAWACFSPASAAAQEPAGPAASGDAADATRNDQIPVLEESIQVTATRVPEDVEAVPASITIVTGDELRARGAYDLPSALALVAGVAVAPGGDNGPASSVPEIWGLREFDAFLLVVDGVPWGGAFNPSLSTLNLNDVDRIEIQRGPAPVMYGATSFVGVIHVLHRQAGTAGSTARLWGGSHGSGGAAVSLALPQLGTWRQSLTVDGDRQGFKDDRTEFTRGHVLYRGSRQAAGGNLRFDFDGTVLKQDPASPHPRAGAGLTSLVPLDANHNPRDAKLDESRLHFVGGYDRKLGGSDWSTTLAFTQSERDTLRGFLSSVSEPTAAAPDNARGYEQDLETTDVYFDTHFAFRPSDALQIVAGFDHLYGRAEADAETFSYGVRLNGSGAPSSGGLAREMGFEVEDERNFSGLYAQAEWTPVHRLRIQIGARLNRTTEDREAGEEELSGPDAGEEEEEGKVERTTTRGSGAVGVSFLAWESGSDALWVYADWRNTFKPAAIDFGPESEAEILEPETARAYEVGLKGHSLGGRLDWDLSGFHMDFKNLVLSQLVNGLPRLINAGEESFEGVELETRYSLRPDLLWQLSYAWHDAKFEDFLREFDGSPRQLRGNRLEMSANHLGSTGLLYVPAHGFNGSVLYNYVGDRYLNQRNTALAPSYSTWSASLGYRFDRWGLRLDGDNLGDERPPVGESELGDAQYYRLPARSFRLSFDTRF